MKKTNKENVIISQIIEKELGITFSNTEYPLSGWGHVDNSCSVSINTLILLECENGQKHPTTNLLKLWPFLEGVSEEVNVILIHYFFPKNRIPKNRLRLCTFLGAKLEEMHTDTFQYVSMSCVPADIPAELRKFNTKWMEIFLNHGNDLRKTKKNNK